MGEKPIKVSDGSQVVKIVLGVVFLIGAAIYGFVLLSYIKQIANQPQPLGVATNELSFDDTFVTSTQTACVVGNVSTSVVAAQPGRSSFIAANVGPTASVIWLCRGSGACSATSGIPLYPSSTGAGAVYKQTDGYIGPYVCRGDTATSSLNANFSK